MLYKVITAFPHTSLKNQSCHYVIDLNVVTALRLFKHLYISYFYFVLELLGTVDFMTSDGTIIFRTSPEEKERVVFQMVSCCYYENMSDFRMFI